MEEIQKIKLLIIEEDSNDADILMEILDNSNDVAIYGAYELESQWVKNLEEAKERMEEFKCDMIFLNLNLDDKISFDVLRTMKTVATDIPIIVTTTYLNRKLWQEVFLEGAQDFILKNSIDNTHLVIKTIFYTFERLKYQNQHCPTPLIT